MTGVGMATVSVLVVATVAAIRPLLLCLLRTSRRSVSGALGYRNAAARKDVGHAVHESKLNEGEVVLGGQLAPYKVEHLHGPLREEGGRRDGVSTERTEVGIVSWTGRVWI